jgi:hypothetical protein
MLVLLDNDIPYGLRRLIRPHACFHAKQMDWTALQNGHLLRAAEGREFKVLITADQNMYYQQNNKMRAIALVVLSTTNWKLIQVAYEQIVAAVEASSPGSFQYLKI